MKKKLVLAPSLLSADFSDLKGQIKLVEDGGADWLHMDVMDGHFVPNITFGPVVIKWVKKAAKIPLDVHLMISDPEKHCEAFAKAGSDYITFHIEAVKNPLDVIAKIKGFGKKAGISIKPNSKVDSIRPLLDKLDLVLVMSVEPGFGGQEFMESAIPKIKELRKAYKGLISVDGGITDKTCKGVIEAGADVLVAGNYVFGSSNVADALRRLLQCQK